MTVVSRRWAFQRSLPRREKIATAPPGSFAAGSSKPNPTLGAARDGAELGPVIAASLKLPGPPSAVPVFVCSSSAVRREAEPQDLAAVLVGQCIDGAVRSLHHVADTLPHRNPLFSVTFSPSNVNLMIASEERQSGDCPSSRE